jgi:hypothetical protein
MDVAHWPNRSVPGSHRCQQTVVAVCYDRPFFDCAAQPMDSSRHLLGRSFLLPNNVYRQNSLRLTLAPGICLASGARISVRVIWLSCSPCLLPSHGTQPQTNPS